MALGETLRATPTSSPRLGAAAGTMDEQEARTSMRTARLEHLSTGCWHSILKPLERLIQQQMLELSTVASTSTVVRGVQTGPSSLIQLIPSPTPTTSD